jgi:ubiquinone/menaquinone biosynthesis C-methylase UbiE
MMVALAADTYSVPGNRRAEAFAQFAAPYLRGRVLDVGTGAAPVPLYLATHPVELLTGVDPEQAEHPFAFHQGSATALPFSYTTFDTVVCATALDHLFSVLDVGAAVHEFERVLRRGGRFLSWETVVPPKEAGPDEHHHFRLTEKLVWDAFSRVFRPMEMHWHRQGMRDGCAELFSAWEKR